MPEVPGLAVQPESAWPSVGFTIERWHLDPDSVLAGKQRRLNQGEYRSTVVPSIASITPVLRPDMQVLMEEATHALVRLDQMADQVLPGTEFAPLKAVLLRTESASSSEIEGISASSKNLAIAELGEKSGKNATDVVNNVRAMDAAIRLSDEPTIDSVLEMHRALMAGHERHTPGTFRTEQVWIGGASPVTASFVPPASDKVQQNMEDLERFMLRDDVAALSHAALAHAQFETIHPFTDGNGRTGRALLHAMLKRADVNRRVTAPISAGILTDPEGYFEALTEYREGNIEPILETVAHSAMRGAELGRRLVRDLETRHGEMKRSVSARKDSSSHRLVDLLIAHPAVNSRFVSQKLGVSDVTAVSAIERLVNDGILTSASQNRRNRVWVAGGVLHDLDGFAEEIRRAR